MPPRHLFLPLAALTLTLSACNNATQQPQVTPLYPGSSQNIIDFAYGTPRTVSSAASPQTPAWVSAAQQGSLTTFTPDPLKATPRQANVQTVSATGTIGNTPLTFSLRLTALSGTVPAAQAKAQAQGFTPLSTAPGEIIIERRRGEVISYETRRVGNLRAAALDLAQDGDIISMTPQARMKALDTITVNKAIPFDSGDPLSVKQWDMARLGYADVLKDTPTAYKTPITVAVVDSGITPHPDFEGRVYPTGDGPMDFVSDEYSSDGDGVDTNPYDPGYQGMSHGTEVAGVIAAARNGVGIVGRTLDAPIKVLPVRVLGTGADGNLSGIVAGIRYASGQSVQIGTTIYQNPHPAQVINLSLGADEASLTQAQRDLICAAVKSAQDKGSLLVAAAGNNGQAMTYLPGACSGVINVASVGIDQNGQWIHATYSNTSPSVTLAAPGGQYGTAYNGLTNNDGILTTEWDYAQKTGIYAYTAGTSSAAPQVSAVAALMLSKGIVTNAADATQRLKDTALKLNLSAEEVGVGLLQPKAALLAPTTPVTPINPTPPVNPSPSTAMKVIITTQGYTFTPTVQSDGRWTAYLPAGSYQVTEGIDKDGNGQLEAGEVTKSGGVTVSAGKSAAF